MPTSDQLCAAPASSIFELSMNSWQELPPFIQSVVPSPALAVSNIVRPDFEETVFNNLELSVSDGGEGAMTKARILVLDEVIQHPFSFEDTPLPSIGPRDHHLGTCKPCGFLHKKGCTAGSC